MRRRERKQRDIMTQMKKRHGSEIIAHRVDSKQGNQKYVDENCDIVLQKQIKTKQTKSNQHYLEFS